MTPPLFGFGAGVTVDHPLYVDAAGGPKLCNARAYARKPLVMLSGGLAAHHGVVLGLPCRLVADAASPLKFSGMGEILPMDAKVAREEEKDGRRWVVLLGDHSAFIPLFGKHVRIEYAPGPHEIVGRAPVGGAK